MSGAGNEHFHADYATSFAPLDLGRALYHPASSKELHPNAIGYFDSYGYWVYLLGLDNDKELKSAGLSKPGVVTGELDVESTSWPEPITPHHVSGVQLHAKTGVNLSQYGLPATCKFAYQFKSEKESGAVLITSPNVVRRRSNLRWGVLEDWVEKNIPALMMGSLKKDIERFELCIIQDTHNVDKFAINVWKGAGKEVYFGSEAIGASVLDAAAGLEWYKGKSIGYWKYGEAPGVPEERPKSKGIARSKHTSSKEKAERKENAKQKTKADTNNKAEHKAAAEAEESTEHAQKPESKGTATSQGKPNSERQCWTKPEPQDKLVVFAGGLRVKVTKQFGRPKPSIQALRAGGDSEPKRQAEVQLDENTTVVVEFEPFGPIADNRDVHDAELMDDLDEDDFAADNEDEEGDQLVL